MFVFKHKRNTVHCISLMLMNVNCRGYHSCKSVKRLCYLLF